MTSAPVRITIAPELLGRIRLGALVLEGVHVARADAGLAAEVEACAREMRQRHAGLRSAEVPRVEEARALYKALGSDPTKNRPSNEALLRRVLKGEPLSAVNTLVDALNLCSLREQLPFGLYDLASVEPPVELRRGRPGESYAGIRKAAVGLESRPLLADARGPFGNPSADSARSMVTTATTRALVVAYAPQRWAASRLLEVLERTEAALSRYCGGSCSGRATLG